jgi:hypothetical protein
LIAIEATNILQNIRIEQKKKIANYLSIPVPQTDVKTFGKSVYNRDVSPDHKPMTAREQLFLYIRGKQLQHAVNTSLLPIR